MSEELRARRRPSARGLRRAALSVSLATSLLLPPRASAAPAGPDLVKLDADFRRGQQEYSRGEYLSAAQTWTKAAALLPETPEHRDNRAGIYEYIAEAYERVCTDTTEQRPFVEALGVLDAYAEGHSKAYPGQSLPEVVVRVRLALRARLTDLQSATRDAPAEAQPRPSAAVSSMPEGRVSAKPWKGMLIGGSSAAGAGVAMMAVFGVTLSQTSKREQDFLANNCDLKAPSSVCSEILSRGEASDRAAVASLILGPLLITTGSALLGVAIRRKNARQSVAPMLGRKAAGVTWTLSF